MPRLQLSACLAATECVLFVCVLHVSCIICHAARPTAAFVALAFDVAAVVAAAVDVAAG